MLDHPTPRRRQISTSLLFYDSNVDAPISSDLLSRHVNKCHAAAKPPTTTQPARRKGHAQPGASTSGVRGPGPPLGAPPGGAGGSLSGVGAGLGGLARRICDPCGASRTPSQCDAGVPCGL